VLYFFAPQLQLSAHFGRRCTILEIVKLGDDDWNLLWLGKILFVKAGVVEGEWGKACNLWYIMLMIEKIDEWVVETLW